MKRVPPPDCPPDRPIGALIPAALPRPRPLPAPVGDLPPAPPTAVSGSTGSGPAVYAIARLNPSGQISARTIMAALRWAAGDPIAVTVRHGAIVVRPAEHSRRIIGAGNSLVLPIAARRMCAIPAGSSVLLIAVPDADALIIHPIADIARLLARRHARILEGPS